MKDYTTRSGSPDPSSDPGQSPTLDWVVSSGNVDQVFDQVAARLRRRRRGRISAFAGGMAALVVAAFVWRGQWMTQTKPPAAQVLASAVIVLPAKQVLPDGSVVELREGAAISVEFTDAFRRVILRHGEGHFHVAKNANRPFVVVAGGVEVRAIGTAFSVQLGIRAVDVLVTDGTVAVTSEDDSRKKQSGGHNDENGISNVQPSVAGVPSSPSSGVLVTKGNRVVVEISPQSSAMQPPVLPMSEAELTDRLSWRVPKLQFSGTPLAQAIPMFNQYAHVRLVLGDTSLGALELSGLMRADNTDSLLRLLQDEFGIKAQRSGDAIVLRR